MTIPVGLALCDRAVDDHTLARITGIGAPKVQLEAVELQLENWDKYKTYIGKFHDLSDIFSDEYIQEGNGLLRTSLKIAKAARFKSFHAPIWAGNISSLDDRVARQAMEITKKSMDAAQHFGTHVFVLHPVRYEWFYWQQFPGHVNSYMDLRKKSADIFIERLKQLAAHYASEGHTYQIGIENLEFNQYPSTVNEIKDLLGRSREAWGSIAPFSPGLGLVLDIQHLKHAKAVLEDNYENQIQFMISEDERREMIEYIHTPICREHTEKGPVLNSMFSTMRDDILLVHLAGNNSRHTTHDPILYDLRTFSYGKEQYDNHMLNMKQVLDIMHHSGYKGAIIIEVASNKEIFEERFEDHVQTMDNVKNYLTFLQQQK